MQTLHALASGFQVGIPSGTDRLCMVPITRDSSSGLQYQLLGDALTRKSVRITELSEVGHVPEVRVLNEGDLPVLLVDGAALVGAKQNRVINLTVLAPPKSETILPVSCVEQGRWHSQGSEFSEGKSFQFAGARSNKMRSVSESLASAGRRASNQGQVWQDIESYGSAFGAVAPTGAMEDVFTSVEDAVRDLIRRLDFKSTSVGAAFVSYGRVLGFDLFDSPNTFDAECKKLVRSYVVEAIRQHLPPEASADAHRRAVDATRALLWQLATGEWKNYRGIGLGTDLRLTTVGLVAGALVHQDEIVHLAAFPGEAQDQKADLGSAPSLRRRRVS